MISLGRTPAVYVPSTYSDVIDTLRARSYKAAFEDAWMFSDKGLDVEADTPDGLTFEEARDSSTVEEFLRVFGEVYGGSAHENEPYGGLPPTYVEALSNGLRSSDESRRNYVGRLDGSVVSIATLCLRDGNAAIYNVGTIPTQRKRGIGSAISSFCVLEAHKHNSKNIFLQTEIGSTNESFYSKLGFRTAYSCICFEKGS